MRKQGRLKSWNDKKGFGFIANPSGGADTFIHISAFKKRNVRPVINQTIIFTPSKDEQGRPRATLAELKDFNNFVSVKTASVNFAMGFKAKLLIAGSAGFMMIVLALVLFNRLPLFVLYLYSILSIVSIAFYQIDKFAAQQGHWRTTEKFLQLLSLIGGWPGAIVMQQLLKHKSKKLSFRLKHFVMVAINLLGFYWMLTGQGQSIIWFIDDSIKSLIEGIIRFIA
jgi:uncharacterized membrane protein YsdA (DUF1294 family)/cold shock CspA family protein